jgi:SAM-dependent methyltransferase
MTFRLLNLGCGDRYHPDWVNVDFHSSNPSVLAHDLKGKLPFKDDSFDVVYHSHLQEHLPKKNVPMLFHECFRILKPGGIIRVVVPDLEQIVRIYLELLERSLNDDPVAQTRYDWILLELIDQIARNESGGDMIKYWMQRPMPAEDFVIARVGSEAISVINHVRNSEHNNSSGETSSADNEEYETIGKFRSSGEVHQWMYDRYSVRTLFQNAGFEEIRQCNADESTIPNFNDYLLDRESDGSVRKPDSLFMEAKKPVHENETDRAERLERVHRLDAQLIESASGRAEKHGIIYELEAQLRKSEADRADRLRVIHQLQAQLQELHAAYAAQEDAFYKMRAELRACMDGLTLRSEVIQKMESSFSWKTTAPLRWLGRHLRSML